MSENNVRDLHPCFGKKTNKGRIHLPVCPACNIECLFCDRKLNDTENRPGVASAILTPNEAADLVERALDACPAITVAGIAGPGDSLVGNNAIETFERIRERHPGLLKCLSTNGLLLSERAEELLALGIDTLTVTVNAVDPAILKLIVAGIAYHGKRYTGQEAAEILIRNQLEGIQKMASRSVIIKVNTVLIPGVNGQHIGEIAQTVARAGAQLYNIIPLIPQNGFAHVPEPTCLQIETARAQAEPYIEVFRHCQRCRADAAGIPGKVDVGDQIYLKKLQVTETFSHG